MADNDHDDIPTLGEIIFPGNPKKVARPTGEKPAVKNQESGRQPPPAASHRPSQTQEPRPKPSNFEALISARVDHILEKHMEAARSEIVRMVMLELRARLPGTNQPPR